MNFKTFKNALQPKTFTIDHEHYIVKNDAYSVLDYQLKTSGQEFSFKELILSFIEPQTKKENWKNILSLKLDDLDLESIKSIALLINEVIDYHAGSSGDKDKKSPSEK